MRIKYTRHRDYDGDEYYALKVQTPEGPVHLHKEWIYSFEFEHTTRKRLAQRIRQVRHRLRSL